MWSRILVMWNEDFCRYYQGVQLCKGLQGCRGTTVRHQHHGRMGQQMATAI